MPDATRSTHTRSRSVADWLLLWFFRRSERRLIAGVPVAVPDDLPDPEAAFAKITDAFELLQTHGGRCLDDLRHHASGIFVWTTAGVHGEWHPRTRLVVLEESYVSDERTSRRDIASTLVHESTHARLDARGFVYSGDRRARIERVCFRRQLAFARRLAEPGGLIERAQGQLRRPPSHFTHQATRERTVHKLIALGVPRWLAKVVEWVTRSGHCSSGT